ncbi:hypothetical protein KC19_1G063800 [Ceratodon purpureus]|uniref:Uncharacterized protein n=1 Tax=Ceratodon purpureus TaxID=3225 RepID=A0A8T0J268_CERPU|nr:hypothetical protein KC19_1G063800 [Ceratodon purpureus]
MVLKITHNTFSYLGSTSDNDPCFFQTPAILSCNSHQTNLDARTNHQTSTNKELNCPARTLNNPDYSSSSEVEVGDGATIS